MATPYVPPKDADFLTWAENFADLITASPATYGLDSVAAAAIQLAVDDYSAAYALAVNPATRTPVTVANKDSARIVANGITRTYAAQIRINPGVTNGDKLALGLNLPNNSPSPIPAPTSFPLLTFLSAGPLTHQFSYKDSDTPVGKAKAPGAVQMYLYAQAATTVGTDPDTFLLKQPVTKSPFLVEWGPGDAGKIATYAARWVTRRGLMGPWSSLSNFTIVAA